MTTYVYHSKNPTHDPYLTTIGIQLAGLELLKQEYISEYYTVHYYDAVKMFQKNEGYSVTGTFLPEQIEYLGVKYSQLLEATTSRTLTRSADTDADDNQFIQDSFFRSHHDHWLRQNGYDIAIEIGDLQQYKKTIRDVHVRSKTTVIDASGMPIAETYEFVAKDVTELIKNK